MLVLVVNAGSSSLKSQLIETEGKITRMKCLAEKLGSANASMAISFAPDFKKAVYSVANLSVSQCLRKLLDIMEEEPDSPISGLDQIDAIVTAS
jgi:acetate kinase